MGVFGPHVSLVDVQIHFSGVYMWGHRIGGRLVSKVLPPGFPRCLMVMLLVTGHPRLFLAL